MSDSEKLKKIKSSFFARGLSMAKLTLNTGAGLAAHGIGTLLSDQDGKDQKWKQFLRNQAEDLSEELGKLKGSLMKAGQFLSMYGEYFLPPEANQFLKNLQSNSPSVAWPVMEKLLTERMTQEQLAQLEIEHEPIGSASLGQAHRARIKASGEWIVLKIQYPGVDLAIDSDLKAVKGFLSMSKLLPKNFNLDPLFTEIKSMLEQEIDYRREAEQTIQYRERLHGDERYVVPKIYPEFCADKVIATSWEKGLSPDDPLVKSLSQERRNALALKFLNLYFLELFEWGIVQTDPHLGNYKVRLNPDGEDQLVLLDFGAVRAYEPQFLQPYYRMIKALVENNKQALQEAALELKFIQTGDDPQLLQLFEDFCLLTMEPFLDKDDPRASQTLMNAQGEYKFKDSDLPQRATKVAMQIIQGFFVRPPPREIIFLDRKTGGVFMFLIVMEAQINGRNLLLSYLKSK